MLDLTNAARQKRWRARRKAELIRLRTARTEAAAEIAALQRQLAARKPRRPRQAK